MRTDPLSGARMRLQRAEEHRGQFRERNPYRMLREHDLDRGVDYYLWRAKIVEEPPYEKWSSLIGECAHVLRSALEYTAFAVVNAKTHVSDKSGLPILDTQRSAGSMHAPGLQHCS